MTDKTFGGLTAAGSLNAADLLAIENADGNSRKITAARARTFMASAVAANLATHIADTEAHGISAFFKTLVGSSNKAALLTLLGFELTGDGSSGKFDCGGLLTLTWRDFSATTGTHTQAYGQDHVYATWARAWMSGDDSNVDVSTALVGQNLSTGTIYSHASGSVSCTLFAWGV